MVTHNDEPTFVDGLTRLELVQEIGQAVATCEPPQVFGVHGDWGLGKTSTLLQLRAHLSKDCLQCDDGDSVDAAVRRAGEFGLEIGAWEKEVVVVWFEAWRHQASEIPVVALLHEMRSQLSSIAQLKNSVGKILNVAARTALFCLDDLAKKIGIQSLGPSKIQKAGERWEKDRLAAELPADAIRRHLEYAVGQLLTALFPGGTEDPKRVVVIIDDLDRCEPETAYRLMEGLKIYLNLSNCVFVLGMNQKLIESAVAKNLPPAADFPSEFRAAAYLEKLCQNIWRIPTVGNGQAFLFSMLDGNLNDKIAAALYGLDYPCLPPNPRRLKGLANVLLRWRGRLDRLLQSQRADDGKRLTRLLLIVAYVHQLNPDLYRRWERSPKLWDKLVEWCSGRFVPTAENISDFDFLLRLLPVGRARSNPTSARVSLEWEDLYPDPFDNRYFWPQRLVVSVAEQGGVSGEEIRLAFGVTE